MMKKAKIIGLLLATMMFLVSCNRLDSDLFGDMSDSFDFSFEFGDIFDSFGSFGDSSSDDTYTIMIYMVGSDLETNIQAASSDILEMLNSGVDTTKTNVLICTGGASQWALDIPNDKMSIFHMIDSEDATTVEVVGEAEGVNMGESEALAALLEIGYYDYPADHYSLICWDHGAGPIGGFGYDEVYEDMLYFNELKDAMDMSPFGNEEKLEWIGFDACLMATIEMANLFSEYANYMIASEEAEEGCGWDYSFLSIFDSTADTEKIAKRIIDSYEDHVNENASIWYHPDITLSCMDLSKTDVVAEAMDMLFTEMDGKLDDIGGYTSLAKLRSEVKAFGKSQSNESGYDLVDLGDLADVMSENYPKEAKSLNKAIDELVVYETSNVASTSGVSIYYPYESADLYLVYAYLEEMGQASLESMYKSDAYREYFTSFVESWTLGQNKNSWKGTVPEIKEEASDEEALLTMQLTEQQMEELSVAYYTVMFRTNDESYFPILANCKIAPDSDGLLTVNWDKEIIVAVSDHTTTKRFWPFMQVEEREDGVVYQSLSTALEGALGTMASTDPQWVKINIEEDNNSEIKIKNINYDQEDTWLSGKQTVDMSKWDNISFRFTGYVPERDKEQNMTPYYDWESDGSFLAYNFVFDDSFRFEKCSALDFEYQFAVQITLVDIYGNVYASELVDLENEGFPKVHIESNEDGTYKWKLYDDHAVLSKYIGQSNTLIIPDKIEGLPVTKIDRGAIDGDFSEIILPETIEYLDEYAFSGCKELAKIELPDSISKIPESAFLGCSALTEVRLPDGIISIGRNAFNGCVSLTTLEISKNVEYIGAGAFENCDSLTDLIVDKKNKYFTVEDRVLFSKDKTKLVAFLGKDRSSYSVPEGVEEICDFAFAGSYEETKETDYDTGKTSITVVGLTEITLPSTLKIIGDGAFYECKGFKSIDIPDSVESIGSLAFGTFPSIIFDTEAIVLDYINIGSNVSWIGLNAFSAYQVNNLQVSEDNSYYSSVNNVLMNKAGDMVIDVFAEDTNEENQ